MIKDNFELLTLKTLPLTFSSVLAAKGGVES